MSPHESRFIRRVFALGGARLRPGDERRFRVVWIDDDGIPVVRVLDDPERVPVIELRLPGFVTGIVKTRRDQFPDGFDEGKILHAVRAARRLRQGL